MKLTTSPIVRAAFLLIIACTSGCASREGSAPAAAPASAPEWTQERMESRAVSIARHLAAIAPSETTSALYAPTAMITVFGKNGTRTKELPEALRDGHPLHRYAQNMPMRVTSITDDRGQTLVEIETGFVPDRPIRWKIWISEFKSPAWRVRSEHVIDRSVEFPPPGSQPPPIQW